MKILSVLSIWLISSSTPHCILSHLWWSKTNNISISSNRGRDKVPLHHAAWNKDGADPPWDPCRPPIWTHPSLGHRHSAHPTQRLHHHSLQDCPGTEQNRDQYEKWIEVCHPPSLSPTSPLSIMYIMYNEQWTVFIYNYLLK